jgi:ABC-2 type transport system permease protein
MATATAPTPTVVTVGSKPSSRVPFAELWTYRTLIVNLTEREFKAKYKKSILGWLWSLLNPLSTLAVFTLVFGTFLGGKAPAASNGTTAFAVYLFSGLVVWNMFSNIVNGSIAALALNADLLKKVYFPPECPAVANVLAALVQAAIETAILMIVLMLFGNVSWTFLLWPILVVLVVCFSLGMGLVLSLANVYYRDVEYLISIFMQLLFYCTPIVWSIALVGPKKLGPFSIDQLLHFNPVATYVGAARDLVWYLQVPSLSRSIACVLWAVASLLVGWFVFRAKSVNVSEEL